MFHKISNGTTTDGDAKKLKTIIILSVLGAFLLGSCLAGLFFHV